MKIKLSIICMCFFITACQNVQRNNTDQKANQEESVQQISTQEILKQKNLVAVRQSNQILLVDPATGSFAPIYQFQEGEVPTTNRFSDFTLSPSQQWAVWYSSTKGILALNVVTGTVKVVEEYNDWLSKRPYMEFSQKNDDLYFISNEGKSLNRVNLTSEKIEEFAIPFPFGNEFRIAPDEKKILYITGFDPNPQRPRFLFAQVPHDNARSFSTETELTDRYLVIWDQNSNAIITIKDQQLVMFPYEDPQTPQVVLDVAPGTIQDLKKVTNLLYALDNQGYWHILDMQEKYKEIARTPTSIVSELRNPKFIPWTDNQFLLTETFSNEELVYSRLWVSNYRGNKRMILTQFLESQKEVIAVP